MTSRRRSDRGRVRVGLFGLLGSGNIGNDGSLEALIGHVRRIDPAVELGFFCMGAETVAARYGAPAVSLQWYEPHAGDAVGAHAAALKVLGKLLDPLRTLLWVRHFDVVLVPGMGVLETTVPVRPWALPYSLFWLALTARLCGTKMALVSVGASRARTWATRRLLVWSAQLATYRSFRDELSREAMREMGVDVSRDRVHPDLVFSLPRPEAVRGEGVVAVGVMHYRGGNDDRSRGHEIHHRYVEAMTAFVHWLVELGWQVRLYATDQEDLPVVDAVLESVRSTGLDTERAALQPTTTIEDLLEGLARADLVVASRFHNVLGGLMLSRPTVSIGYAAKHEVLMEDFGMAAFSEPASTLDVGRLVATFEALERDRDGIVAALDRRNAEITVSSQEQLSAIALLMTGRESDVTPGTSVSLLAAQVPLHLTEDPAVATEGPVGP